MRLWEVQEHNQAGGGTEARQQGCPRACSFKEVGGEVIIMGQEMGWGEWGVMETIVGEGVRKKEQIFPEG